MPGPACNKLAAAQGHHVLHLNKSRPVQQRNQHLHIAGRVKLLLCKHVDPRADCAGPVMAWRCWLMLNCECCVAAAATAEDLSVAAHVARDAGTLARKPIVRQLNQALQSPEA